MAAETPKSPEIGYTKGTQVVFVRDLIRKQGLEAQFMARLTPEQQKEVTRMLPVFRIPDDVEGYYSEIGAAVLFPGEPRVTQINKLSRLLAQNDLKGIYKFLLNFTTIQFAFKQVAALWSTYHDRGKARIEADPSGRRAWMIIEDYPGLPENVRVAIAGYVLGVLDVVGQKNGRCRLDDSNPSAWRWEIAW